MLEYVSWCCVLMEILENEKHVRYWSVRIVGEVSDLGLGELIEAPMFGL